MKEICNENNNKTNLRTVFYIGVPEDLVFLHSALFQICECVEQMWDSWKHVTGLRMMDMLLVWSESGSVFNGIAF